MPMVILALTSPSLELCQLIQVSFEPFEEIFTASFLCHCSYSHADCRQASKDYHR
jgi:hypothetical protein